ncbi:MAG: tRNA (adenosine(37)-N6)-threonylcarbamoyltransferase complex ATPase subunit type 1 TsaE [Magnetococcales bacterium]|nr:tRNA (adenosine(37)-N6)-threonylcarbamoyltransferase complex ATPase subunit type 1 TsaE [Magnetococcales bacterium]
MPVGHLPDGGRLPRGRGGGVGGATPVVATPQVDEPHDHDGQQNFPDHADIPVQAIHSPSRVTPSWPLTSLSEEETRLWGYRLGQCLTKGCLITLEGDLGAGKSVFARGVMRGLGVAEDWLPSPTFTLMNLYESGRLPVYHLDLYRLADPDELAVIGGESWMDGQGVCLVEWPGNGGDWLPPERLEVAMAAPSPDREDERILRFSAIGEIARQALGRLRREYGT